MRKYNQQFSFNISTTDKVTHNLPPTSAQSFLRDNITFPAVVLNSNPQNRFYHSIFDDQANIKFKYFNTTQDFTEATALNDNLDFPANSIQLAIRNVSTVLAASLYQMITGDPYKLDKGSNPVLVSGCDGIYLEQKVNKSPFYRSMSCCSVSWCRQSVHYLELQVQRIYQIDQMRHLH